MLRIPFLVRSDHNDISYTVVSVAVWVAVETNVGIVCACLPTMRPLLKHGISALSFPKLRSMKKAFYRGSRSGEQARPLEKGSLSGSTTLAHSEWEDTTIPFGSFRSKDDQRSSRLTAEWRANSEYGGGMGLPANGQLSRLAHSSPWNEFRRNPMEEAGQLSA